MQLRLKHNSEKPWLKLLTDHNSASPQKLQKISKSLSKGNSELSKYRDIFSLWLQVFLKSGLVLEAKILSLNRYSSPSGKFILQSKIRKDLWPQITKSWRDFQLQYHQDLIKWFWEQLFQNMRNITARLDHHSEVTVCQHLSTTLIY